MKTEIAIYQNNNLYELKNLNLIDLRLKTLYKI